MPKSTVDIANAVQESLRNEKKDVFTFTWPGFYEFVERERIKEQFKLDLASSLRQLGLLISYGQAVVLIGKDYHFSPSKT